MEKETSKVDFVLKNCFLPPNSAADPSGRRLLFYHHKGQILLFPRRTVDIFQKCGIIKEQSHQRSERMIPSMGFETLLFDLDGTLTDSAPGITNSVMYALHKFGIEVEDKQSLNKFVGPPLWDSFENFYGFSHEQAQEAVQYYREYYTEKGIFENTVYTGIPDLLKTLTGRHKRLLVATSKPEVFANKILDHFDLTRYFTLIVGCELDGTRAKKGEVIHYALDSSPSDRSKTIMIGDRKEDILGAKEAGILSIGVLYGYGGKSELEQAGADYFAPTVADIARLT